jgi:serine/threonine-protein kinase
MAPEQVRSARVDARADVWGVAVTMLEAMSGRLMFDGEDPPSIMSKVLTEDVERPRHVAAMDDRLWEIFAHALRREPEERLDSARALHDALEAWRGVSAPPRRSPETVGAAAPAEPSLDALIRARLGDA